VARDPGLIEIEARLDLTGAALSIGEETQDRDSDRVSKRLSDLRHLGIPGRRYWIFFYAFMHHIAYIDLRDCYCQGTVCTNRNQAVAQTSSLNPSLSEEIP
jgi:hypothetical protein